MSLPPEDPASPRGGWSAPATDILPRLDFDAARRSVEVVARPTPLLEAPALSDLVRTPVLLKLECLQVTGSFKVRGAASRLGMLDEPSRRAGVVACSSGNHGRAIAYVAHKLGIPATVYVPDWVDPVKLEGIRAHGAEAVLAGATFDEAEARAVRDAGSSGRTYVSAYDDPGVIAGQGTIALEVLDALGEPPEAVLVPLSGGGLVGGMAAAFESRLAKTPSSPCVAVSAERAAVMLASLRAGRPMELPEEETVASALSGGIGLDNQWSLSLVRDLVPAHVVVTEEEILRAMAFAWRELHLVVEGGGAVGLAALLSGRWRPEPDAAGAVVVVVSGGNVSRDTLMKVLSPLE
ncbi:MAG: pyridoxal-phosphate dependent enzyme [Gemmatimonadetes bacterium]|nr:pyridoxal-phosphate dependent enzyme [Gemmatimonadota bacterium]